MNILQFIFKDIWTFIGTIILMYIIGEIFTIIINNILKIYLASKMIKNNKSVEEIQNLLSRKDSQKEDS